MNILISFCCVLLIVNLSVRSEDSEHDSIKNNHKNVKRHHENNSKNITHNSNNDNIIGKSTTIPNITNQETSLQNVLRLHASPSFNGIPRRTLSILKNDEMKNEKNKLGRAVNILNATRFPVKLAEKENRSFKPLIFQLNDPNKPNKANNSEESILNTTVLSQNNTVISNNETKVMPIVEITTKSDNKEEKIERSQANVVTENKQHESKNKHHHKHYHHNNEKVNETIKNSTDINILPEKEEIPVDKKISKNTLEKEKNNKEEPDRNNFSNLLFKLSNLDAWNEINYKPVEIESTSPGNYITSLKNGFSEKTIELGDSSTKFEESNLLKYIRNQNARDDNNQDLSKNPYITENKLQIAHILYSELRPRCDKVILNNKLFDDYEHQPQTNNVYSYYQKQLYNQQHQRQHQHFMNVPSKLNKPLILPCLQRIWNTKPYFECDMNDYDDRESKYIYSNIVKSSTDEPKMNYIKPYQNNFIKLDGNFHRNDHLGPHLEVKRDSERYDEINNWASCSCS